MTRDDVKATLDQVGWAGFDRQTTPVRVFAFSPIIWRHVSLIPRTLQPDLFDDAHNHE